MFVTQPLSQRDVRWRDQPLGFGDNQTTIGSDGCTLTCLTMVATGYGFTETPASLNRKLKDLGPGRGFSNALMVWSGLPAALPGILLVSLQECSSTPAPLDAINTALAAGKPVVVEIDRTLATGIQNHWVLIYDRAGDDYLIHDPWPVAVEPSTSLVASYGLGRTAAQVITYVVQYDGPAGAPGGTPPATTTEPLAVVVNDDPDVQAIGGLRLRAAPVDGDVKMLLPAGTTLQVVEPADAARVKIGTQGQWLHISSPTGASGFVAAWYVHAVAVPVSLGLLAPLVAQPVAISMAASSIIQPPLHRPPSMVVVVNQPTPSTRKARNVALRSKPSTGTVIARLQPGDQLDVIETAKSATPKLGVRGQWINVRDGQGHAGFVSAVSVHRSQA